MAPTKEFAMMDDKFNAKGYQGKDRVYQPVPGKSGILRLYVWDSKRKQYSDPPNGRKYDTRRIEIGENGVRRRKKKVFKYLDEAVHWQQGNEKLCESNSSFSNLNQFISAQSQARGLTFSELIQEFRKKQFPKMGASTRSRYDRMLEQYFFVLDDLVVSSLKPSGVDLWLEQVRKLSKSSGRKFFKHELDLLKNLIGFYKEYYDEDNVFNSPFRKRHTLEAKNGHISEDTEDLPLSDFLKFRENLLGLKHGGKLWLMVTIEFYEALRVSESAALFFEDFKIQKSNPQDSELIVTRGLKWKKDTGSDTQVGTFKNAKFLKGGKKKLPVFPEVLKSLELFYPDWETRKGPMFLTDEGRFFEVRQIQNAYNRAFELAGLDYTGTHIFRHGGCRLLLNQTGDLCIAQQHLGNSSLETTKVYAKRSQDALSKAVEKQWKKLELVVN